MSQPLKTRFCPSPTGQMHLGNVRTALFNFLWARRQNGHFLLRIEDTDKSRSKDAFVENLKADLAWLELQWDEGPYFQSERQTIYDKFYQTLKEQQKAYPCFCTDDQLALARKIQMSSGKAPRYQGTCAKLSLDDIQKKLALGLKPALRFRVPSNNEILFEDLIKGKQTFQSNDIGDFIIQRADGSASFFFSNAVDDALMGVTCAIRGEDHLANTPRQLMIVGALGLTPPQYGHLPLILSKEGDKLSKREGSQNLDTLRTHGYLPIAILNYLGRLGHHYEKNHLMSLSEMIENFALSHTGNTPSHFDDIQLLHWQKQAVMQLSPKDFSQWAIALMDDDTQSKVPHADWDKFIQLIHPNVLFPHELSQWINILYGDIAFSEPAQLILKNTDAQFFEVFSTAVNEDKNYPEMIEHISKTLNIKGKNLFQPLRIILTGQLQGPELESLYNLLGKEKLLAKIDHAKGICAPIISTPPM